MQQPLRSAAVMAVVWPQVLHKRYVTVTSSCEGT